MHYTCKQHYCNSISPFSNGKSERRQSRTSGLTSLCAEASFTRLLNITYINEHKGITTKLFETLYSKKFMYIYRKQSKTLRQLFEEIRQI